MAHICCGQDGCLLPWGHEGRCRPAPPRYTRATSGCSDVTEVPVDAACLPAEAWGMCRVRWTVTVVITPDEDN